MTARRLALLAISALALAAAPPAGAYASGLKVMTRNLYVGSGFHHAIAAPNQTEFVKGVSTIWANARHSDFETRAQAIAAEVAAARPHVIGLQEVSLWERATATQPFRTRIDHLASLLGELEALGLSYAPATVSTGFTVTAPAIEDGEPIFLRLTDRDAILVRQDTAELTIDDASSESFAATATVPTAVGPIEIPRTWNTVDGSLGGTPFRVVNTHLEPDFPGVQVAQGQELVAGPFVTTRPLVAVGDFNSAADGSTTPTYGLLRAAGLEDAWRDEAGFTCCQAELLDNLVSQLSERIDLVLTGTGVHTSDVKRVGARAGERVAALWPSDHAGVVAELKLQPRK